MGNAIAALFVLGLFTIPIIKTVKLLLHIIDKKERKKRKAQFENNQVNIDYSTSYQRKLLLTRFEYSEFKKLKEAANKRNYMICPKVRLLDLVEPQSYSPNYKVLLQKVQSKHVDFVICDENLYVKAIIELDDNSHKARDRIERDKFVDTVLKSTGYTVVHVRMIHPNIFEFIDEMQKAERTAYSNQANYQ